MNDAPRPDDSLDAALQEAFTDQHTTALRLIERANGFESQVELRPEPDHIPTPVVAERVRASARYASLDRIAEGGLGEIFRGQDCDLGREVALKVLRLPFRDQPGIVRRFVEEAQIGGQLQHPNILPVYELGLGADQRPFIAMKLVRGETLAKLLTDRPDPSAGTRRFLGIFEQLCQAIAYVHARGVVHRDLKPGNVMVGAFGEVQVMDFGFAKVLHHAGAAPDEIQVETIRSASGSYASLVGSVFGTPAYMPPEQAQGRVDELDERADVFALGAILHHILTGAPLYSGADMLEQARRADLEPAFARLAASGAEAELVQIARDCLARDRDARPRSAREVADRVTRFLTGVEERARESALAAERARVQLAGLRRARKLQLALGLVILVVIGLAGFAYWWLERERTSRRDGLIEQARTELRDAEELARQAQQDRDPASAATRWSQAVATTTKLAPVLENADVPVAVRTDLGARVRAIEVGREQADLAETRRQQDQALLARFETLTLPADRYAGGTIGSSWDAELKSRDYEAAFAAYGTHPLRDPEVFIARVSDFSMRAAVALDDWARHLRSLVQQQQGGVDPQSLFAIARRLDPDPVRNRLRDVLSREPIQAAELVRIANEIDLAKEAPETIGELGLALWEIGEYTTAMVTAVRAAREYPDSFLLNYLAGLSHWRVPNQWSEARRLLEIAIGRRPDYAYAHYYAMWACAKLGLQEEADDHYRKAKALQKPDPNMVYELAIMNLENGLVDRAFAEFTELCQLDASAFLHPLILAWSWFWHGRVLELRRDLTGALASYRRAEQILRSPEYAAKRVPPGMVLPNAIGFARRVDGELAGDPSMLPIVDGKRAASSPEEQVEAAMAALRAGRSVTGARLFLAAAEANPQALRQLSNGAVLFGAELAVSAGTGIDPESQALSDAERREWRMRGYRWLRDAYELLAQRDQTSARVRKQNQGLLVGWICCLRLWTTRFEAQRRSLPVDEARAWRALWEDIEAMNAAGDR